MHGVAPQYAIKWRAALLGGEAGGRSPGLLPHLQTAAALAGRVAFADVLNWLLRRDCLDPHRLPFLFQ